MLKKREPWPSKRGRQIGEGKARSGGLARAGYVIWKLHNVGMRRSGGPPGDKPRGEWISFADFGLGVREGIAKDAGEQGGQQCF